MPVEIYTVNNSAATYATIKGTHGKLIKRENNIYNIYRRKKTLIKSISVVGNRIFEYGRRNIKTWQRYKYT